MNMYTTAKTNPAYNQIVLNLMMVFPTLYPSEVHCQNSLFLATGNVFINTDGQLELVEDWEVGDERHPIDRTAVSILGDQKSDHGKQNWEKFHNPVQTVRGYEMCDGPCFHSIGESHLIRYEKFTRRETGKYPFENDIFNSVLNKTFMPTGLWKNQLHMFCFHLERVSLTAYEHYRYAYHIQHSGARQNWEGRFKEDCENLIQLKAAAEEVGNILNPPAEDVPPVDYKKIEQEWVEKKERALRRRLSRVKPKEMKS